MVYMCKKTLGGLCSKLPEDTIFLLWYIVLASFAFDIYYL